MITTAEGLRWGAAAAPVGCLVIFLIILHWRVDR
jgi:hypothetical protein